MALHEPGNGDARDEARPPPASRLPPRRRRSRRSAQASASAPDAQADTGAAPRRGRRTDAIQAPARWHQLGTVNGETLRSPAPSAGRSMVEQGDRTADTGATTTASRSAHLRVGPGTPSPAVRPGSLPRPGNLLAAVQPAASTGQHPQRGDQQRGAWTGSGGGHPIVLSSSILRTRARRARLQWRPHHNTGVVARPGEDDLDRVVVHGVRPSGCSVMVLAM